jgi:hypothetical protein
VLRKKYLKGRSFSQSKQRCGSQFWQGLGGVKDWYVKGTKWGMLAMEKELDFGRMTG